MTTKAVSDRNIVKNNNKMLFANLLVLGFLIKIYACKPLFTYIREKHGLQTLRQCRVFEKLIIRYEKSLHDLRFLLACKKEGLVPKFARPKLSIAACAKIRKGIANIIIKTELKNKHRTRNELREQIRTLCHTIRDATSFLMFNALRWKIRMVVSTRRKKWMTVHKKKLEVLRAETTPFPKKVNPKPHRNVVHNFSSYTLSDQEYEVLSYSLDHYVPGKDMGKRTQVEFERLYQDILNHTWHLSNLTEREKIELKAKFLNTFTKFSKIEIPQEQRKIIENLYKNPDLVILRQDKGRGVVILNRPTYVNKGEAFLNGPEFEKLDNDPTKSFQKQVQDTLLSMKNKFTKKLYKKLYPSSSRPGLYFGLAKVHKLKDSRNVDELPLRPVISNIGTATYELSKYLAELLKPLTKSQYSVESTKDFIERIKNKKIQHDYDLVSFDVVSLFTSVPLDYTIELILNKIYVDKRIETKLTREEMKELLVTCTKEMHFSFNGVIYRQINGVAMGSPLGPVIANVFMVELENTLVPQLEDSVSLWCRYVDDTFTFIKKGSIEFVLEKLNSFHPNIKFTYEVQKDGTIAFLDVKVIRNSDGSFETEVHRKPTDTNVYISWNAFAPKMWKTGTLKGLIRRAYVICSTEDSRNKEIAFLKKVFGEMNGYPSRVIHNCIRDVERKIEEESSPPEAPEAPEAPSTDDDQEAEKEIKPLICLPYKGKDGDKLISQFRDALSKALPSNIKPQFTYQGMKLGSYFKLKDPVPIEHQSNCIYSFKPEGATEYVGETSVRFETRCYQHGNTDKKSAIYKYKRRNRIDIVQEDFEIIERGYTNTVKRKLAEALYIKELNPVLNEQVKSAKLCLFN